MTTKYNLQWLVIDDMLWANDIDAGNISTFNIVSITQEFSDVYALFSI